jgi:hypothetical protein
MSSDPLGEFETRLRRRSPAGPPADLRARVLTRAAEAPGTAGGSTGGIFTPWLALAAAVVVVAVAAVVNARIESVASGGGPAPTQPLLVTVPSPVPGAEPIVLFCPRRAPPVDRETYLKERAQVEALLRS